jgi:putative membrane-bound dehydrogenase-like protein
LRLTPGLLLLILHFTSPALAQREFGFDNRKPSGQPYLSPEETVRRFKVAPEFEVKLFAGEPNCVNPIAFTIDEKGRVWVVECFEYPSRTPKGMAPRDRIVILEDTDGDGACDKRTVFAEGKDFPVTEERKKQGLGAFDLASGIEVGHGGVYVGAPPYLWFIENKNDKPGKFETLLKGFGSEDTHETLNTFQWGPDGWLYGLHGVFTHSKVQPLDGPETRMNAAVWRFHPKTKKFEIFAEGTSNPWGMDWRNTDGQFILACCVIPHLFHSVPGGIYTRQAGAPFNPFAYDLINEICDHTFHRESGWAHAGLISLDAPHIPEKYRNSVIFGSIHGCSVKQNVLKPNGSTFTASRGDDFLVSGDKNFRPINMKWGPNGDIYLIDWHDQNPCHQALPDSWDYERGRVYRIQLKGTKPKKAEDLSALSDEALGGKLDDPNPYVSRQSLRLAYQRFADKPVPVISTPKIRRWENLRMFQAMGNELKFDPAVTAADAPLATAWLVRFAADRGKLTDREIGVMAAAAVPYPDVPVARDPRIRRELASAAVRLAGSQNVTGLLHSLMWHPDDGDDPVIPHLIWVAYEKVLARATGEALDAELAWLAEECQPKPLKPDHIVIPSKTISDHILPKVMRRLVATGRPEDLARCVALVGKLTDNYVPTRRKALAGLALALKDQLVDAPAGWPELQKKLLAANDPAVTELVNALAVSFRDPAALKRAFEAVHNLKLPSEARAEALRIVVRLRHPEAARLVNATLRQDRDQQVRIEAARQLAAFANVTHAAEAVRDWKQFPPPVRAELVNSLASRREWARALLLGLQAKAIDRLDVTDSAVTRIQAFNDRELNALIEKAWGRARPTPKELTAQIDKMRSELNAKPGSFARGKAVFEAQCAKCHVFDGAGSAVGPPLDGAGRDIEYLLANILDPNRVIGAPYFIHQVNTLDGQVIQGLNVGEDDKSLMLKIENGVVRRIAKADLDGKVKVLEKSMMPEGLASNRTVQDFRDLVRYLMLHPYVIEWTLDGTPIQGAVGGQTFLRPPQKTDQPINLEAKVTATADLTTHLLIDCRNAYEVKLDGQAIGVGKRDKRNPEPESFSVKLPKGEHTLTLVIRHTGVTQSVAARFLDPDRKLRYADGR